MSYIGKSRVRRQMLLGRAMRHGGFADDVDPNIEMDCENEATWRSDPTCQELHPGLYPTSPTAGAGGQAPSSTSSGAGITDWLKGITQSVTNAFSSGGSAIATATTKPTTAAQASGGDLKTLALVAAGGLGLYYLTKKKRR